MATTYDEADLRRIAREKCKSGELPARVSPMSWAGPGNGARCSLCDLPIAVGDIEYEVEIGPESKRGPLLIRFHNVCHTAWLSECGGLSVPKVSGPGFSPA
jgi:hypothetical protein